MKIVSARRTSLACPEYARPEMLAARDDRAIEALKAYGVPVIRFAEIERIPA